MKKIFALIALASTQLLSADQYYSGGTGYCSTCNRGRSYYEQADNYYQPREGYQYQSYQRYAPRNEYYDQQQQASQRYGRYDRYDRARDLADRRFDRYDRYDRARDLADRRYDRFDRARDLADRRFDRSQEMADRQYDRSQEMADRRYSQSQEIGEESDRNTDNTRKSRYDQQIGEESNYGRQRGDQKSKTDIEISKKIDDTLSGGWFATGYDNVIANVDNGNVILKGSVESLEQKNKIQEEIKKIDGVKQINNRITIAKENSDTYDSAQEMSKKYPKDVAYTPQDKRLNAQIRDKLSSWLTRDYETIALKTNNGDVIIMGMLEKPEDAQKVEDKIKSIKGIKSVDNQIMVKEK